MEAPNEYPAITPPTKRVGCRFRNPALAAKDWLPSDFGEDWVVPRAPITFLLVHCLPGGSELTAFDADGKIVGDMHEPSAQGLLMFLDHLHERGLVTAPETIPTGRSAVEHLREGRGL